jgi:hypothetical protein
VPQLAGRARPLGIPHHRKARTAAFEHRGARVVEVPLAALADWLRHPEGVAGVSIDPETTDDRLRMVRRSEFLIEADPATEDAAGAGDAPSG